MHAHAHRLSSAGIVILASCAGVGCSHTPDLSRFEAWHADRIRAVMACQEIDPFALKLISPLFPETTVGPPGESAVMFELVRLVGSATTEHRTVHVIQVRRVITDMLTPRGINELALIDGCGVPVKRLGGITDARLDDSGRLWIDHSVAIPLTSERALADPRAFDWLHTGNFWGEAANAVQAMNTCRPALRAGPVQARGREGFIQIEASAAALAAINAAATLTLLPALSTDFAWSDEGTLSPWAFQGVLECAPTGDGPSVTLPITVEGVRPDDPLATRVSVGEPSR